MSGVGDNQLTSEKTGKLLGITIGNISFSFSDT